MDQEAIEQIAAEAPETQLVRALTQHLETSGMDVHMGYAVEGLTSDIETPALLLQLESMIEQSQQGKRSKYQLQFNLSVVDLTHEQTTERLLVLCRLVRLALQTSDRFYPEARKITLSETTFDLAPNHGQLSFADMSLAVEVVL